MILDQTGSVKQQHFESQEEVVEWLEKGLGMKRAGDNKWAKGSKWRIVLAEFNGWSNGLQMVGQITQLAAELKGDPDLRGGRPA